jgi:hypothetical protein
MTHTSRFFKKENKTSCYCQCSVANDATAIERVPCIQDKVKGEEEPIIGREDYFHRIQFVKV